MLTAVVSYWPEADIPLSLQLAAKSGHRSGGRTEADPAEDVAIEQVDDALVMANGETPPDTSEWDAIGCLRFRVIDSCRVV